MDRKKKIFWAILILAIGIAGYSFYADAYDPIKQKGMQTIERKAKVNEFQMQEAAKTENSVNRQQKAIQEMEAWKKLSREEKLKKIEFEHNMRAKKSAESWAKKSADKKIEAYEKKLNNRTLSKEEKAKMGRAKLETRCKELDD